MENTKKYLIAFIFLIILLSIGYCSIYLISLEPYDELWNFQNTYKLYQNLKLYSDANIIVTPLFFYIGLVFLKIFGATIITFRYFNLLLFSIFFICIYYIFKNLNVSKHLNILFETLIFVQIYSIINGGANYNTLYMIFVFLGVIFYLKFYEKNFFHYLQGIIIFLIFFTKQNISIYFTISILVFEFLYKKNYLEYIINQLKKLFSFLICLCIMLYTFYIKGILSNFINYAFGGIFNFSNSNFVITVPFYIIIICISMIILYFYTIFNKKFFNKHVFSEIQRRNFDLIAWITIGISFSVFPILNSAHFMYILPFYLIFLFYFLDFTILEDLFNSKKSVITTYIISFVILTCILIRIIFACFPSNQMYVTVTNKNPFYNIRITAENYEKIHTMTKYVKNKNASNIHVVILTSDSAFTMIPLKQNNQAFDLVFNGNLGYDGENNLIQKIKNSKNTEFLIYTNEQDCFWQESKKVREYIINNLNKTGEILNYSIYE